MSLTQLKAVLSVAGEHLGDLLWWTLADVRIDRKTLEQLWLSAGLPAELLPEIPSSEKSFKLAVRECSTGQAERIIRLGKEDEHELVFAVLRETRDGQGNVSTQQEAKVILDRVADSVSTDQPGHQLAEAILAAFIKLRHTHPADDIRRAMLKVLDSCAAVTLREHGGVYWVPAAHAETVRKLQLAVERIGNSRMYLLPVHKSEEATKTLGDVAKSSVEAELEALKQEIQGFVQSPPARMSTLVHRLDAFETLRAKASLYKQVLEVQVTDLDETLSELATSVEKLLAQKQAA